MQRLNKIISFPQLPEDVLQQNKGVKHEGGQRGMEETEDLVSGEGST